MSLVGGLGEVKPANADIQAICDEVKPHLEGKAGKPFPTFVAKSYRSQVVAGTNHFIKVQVGDTDHVHLRVFKSLPHAGSKVSLSGFQQGKTHDDPIEHFQ